MTKQFFKPSIEIPILKLSSPFIRLPWEPTVKVVAFAYDGAQSQHVYAIGVSCFRSTLWLFATVPHNVILRLMKQNIGAVSMMAKPQNHPTRADL